MSRAVEILLAEAAEELSRYEREHGPGSLARVHVEGFGRDGGRVVRVDAAAEPEPSREPVTSGL